MSREININNSIKLIPNAYTNTGSYHFTNQTIDNAYSDADSTSSNRMMLARNYYSARKSEIYYEFDKSSLTNIPSNATITSITANVKYYVNSTTYVTAVSMQLYSNTTAKGTAVTSRPTGSGQKYSITTGTWTRAELDNIRLYVSGTHNASTDNGYIYFYGADVTVNYNVSGIAYTITAISNVDNVTVTPATQELMEGEDTIVAIYGVSDLNDINITDNDIDVSDQLIHKQLPASGTVSATPESFTTEVSVSGAAFYISSSNATNHFDDPINHTAENPATQPSSNSWTYVKGGTNNNATGWAIYDFDFSSIPINATITSIQVKCYGAKENTSTSAQYKSMIGLYSNTTLKSTEQEFTNTSPYVMTITNPGTWTRDELQNAKLRHTVAYYGGWMGGVTWTVNYENPISGDYYEYTLNNLNSDHVIVVDDATVYIPPEEDPTYNYYPVTISSINATTNPTKGTTRVVEGTNQTITIYPDDPLVTLILDNGVDVSSQLVAYSAGSPTYTVTTQVSGASYGFNLNSSTGYYVSTNNGVSKSASVARINLDLPVRCLITIQYINYAEANYDYGMFGKVDTTVATDGLTASSNSSSPSDSASNYQLAMASNSSSAQTITYEVESGEHFIDVKYGKDDATDNGNDSLQWKVLSIEPLEANNYYTYTLTNIQQSHNLIFVFGDVTYWYINSSGSGCKLYPNGQYVVLDGDSYKLTIVPNENNATVSITDNGSNVTNSLERIESQVEKDGNTITYVNYIYRLSNISSTHNLIINCVSGSTIYMKVNNSWIAISKVYKKIDDRWQEQSDYSSLFDLTKIYVNGTN